MGTSIFQLVVERITARGWVTAEERLACGHVVFFERRQDANGKSHWYDNNGRRASLNVKSRRCEECEMEAAKEEDDV